MESELKKLKADNGKGNYVIYKPIEKKTWEDENGRAWASSIGMNASINEPTISHDDKYVLNGGNTIDVDLTLSNQFYDIYKKYGLTFDLKASKFYLNGELVRRFYDERDSTTVTRLFNPNGVIDVTAIRNDKYELTGLYKHTQQEFDERTAAMANNSTITTEHNKNN